MKRLFLYGLLGVLAYAGFMLVQLPADKFIAFVGRYLPGLSVQHAQGSVFQGNAQGLRWHDTTLEFLSWRWRPLALLNGRVAYNVLGTEPQLNLEAVAGINWTRAIEITDLRGHLALSRAVSLLGRPPPLLEGDLQLAVDQVRLDRNGRLSALEGSANLRETYTTLGQRFELGDFSADFTTEEQTIRGTVKDEGGPLELNGSLTLAPDGRYRFTGQLSVRDKNNRDLQQILGIMGRPGADGKWQLNFSGSLQN